MLAGPINDPPTWLHFSEQYLDCALLLLYVRVTLFRFSRELSDISSEARNCRQPRQVPRQLRQRFEQLRWDFALFTNLYKFPLISNQQQAIEMYTFARKQLDVDALFEEVEEEVRSSHEFMEGAASSELNGWVFALAVLGSLLVIFQVIAWFFKAPNHEFTDVWHWLGRAYHGLGGWLSALIS